MRLTTAFSSLAEVPNCQSSYMRGGIFPSSHDGECASWLGAENFGVGHIAVSLPIPPSCPLQGPWQGLSVPRVFGFSLCQAPPHRQGWEWGEGSLGSWGPRSVASPGAGQAWALSPGLIQS